VLGSSRVQSKLALVHDQPCLARAIGTAPDQWSRSCDCDRPIGKELSGQTRGCDASDLRQGSGNWKDAESIARWLEPDDKDDPKVPGVACHVSQARTGGLSGTVGLAEDPPRVSIACRQVGPINVELASPTDQEEVYSAPHPSFSSATTSTKGWTKNVTRWSISPQR
jgi:CreA protein